MSKEKQKTRSKHLTNKFDSISEDYGIGYTSKGEKFYFDKDDLEKITSISSSWSFNDSGYLGARDMRENAEKYPNGRRKFIYLKDVVMNKKDGEVVKYINSNDKNDNRKSNLIKK